LPLATKEAALTLRLPDELLIWSFGTVLAEEAWTSSENVKTSFVRLGIPLVLTILGGVVPRVTVNTASWLVAEPSAPVTTTENFALF
jgi:hypothetical protein